MTLMPKEANKDVAPSAWNKSRQLLRTLPSHGICILEQRIHSVATSATEGLQRRGDSAYNDDLAGARDKAGVDEPDAAS